MSEGRRATSHEVSRHSTTALSAQNLKVDLMKRVRKFIDAGDATGVQEMHDSGEWPDLEVGVGSAPSELGERYTAPGGLKYTALAMASVRAQLEVMRRLIEMGAKVTELRPGYSRPCHQVASVGFIDGIMLLKSKGCDFALQDSLGYTPVHKAAMNGHMSTLQVFQGWGLSTCTKSKDGTTPGDLATRAGHGDCAFFLKDVMEVKKQVVALLKAGDVDTLRGIYEDGRWGAEKNLALVKEKSQEGSTWHFTPLAYAAKFRQLEMMRWLTSVGARVDETRECSVQHYYFAAPSNITAALGFDEGMKVLKENKCDFSRPDAFGTTPVHEAAGSGHLSSLRLLHGWGEDICARDMYGRTPAAVALRKGKTTHGCTECAEFLQAVMPVIESVKDFIRVGDIESLSRLRADKLLDVDVVVHSTVAVSGYTRHSSALSLASQHQQLKVMAWMIEMGAAASELRDSHYLPPNACAAVDFVEGLELLKSHGCNLSKADTDGRTPVHHAAQFGSCSALRFLRSCGCPMHCIDLRGNTAAHYAAEEDCQGAIQQLFEWDTPLDTKNKKGATPADLAAARKHDDTRKPLGHAACVDLLGRLVEQSKKHHGVHQAITAAIDARDFASANALFRSDKGKEACIKMKSAFAIVVQALDQHSKEMADACLDEEEPGSGAGGQKKTKKKSGASSSSSSSSKNKAVKEELPSIQLDDSTITTTINERLEGTDDDWATLSAAKLRAILIEARPGVAVSEKRMKGIKAAVLEQRLCAQPLPETPGPAQGVSSAEREREEKEERLRERKANKERRRQQAREKQQQEEAIEQQAQQQAREKEEQQAVEDDRSVAVFLEWCDALGYDSIVRFRTAGDDDFASLPLSRKQLKRVLLLLEERNPAAWLMPEGGEGAAGEEGEGAGGEHGEGAGETAPVSTPSSSDATSEAARPPVPLAPPVMTRLEVDSTNEEETCVICYSEPVSVQLVHANETSHECVCVGCSDMLKARGDPCPACRAPIVVHLKTRYKMAQMMPGAV